MSRAIFVLSVPRSGSSALAGALARMGVEMGEGHLQVPDASNPRGYYEDRRWQAINKSLAGHGYSTRRVWMLPDRHRAQYRELAEACGEAAPVWGAKGPRFAFTFHLMWPVVAEVAEVRVIHCTRARDEVLASLERHSQVAYNGAARMTRPQAERLLRRWERALGQSLAAFQGWTYEVDYGELMGTGQAGVLADLEAFCFEGCEGYAAHSLGVEEAAAWLDPTLKHH